MDSIDEILQKAFPGRKVFSESERVLASAVMRAGAVNDGKRLLPTRFVPLGETAVVEGVLYRCVEREYDPCPAAVCDGCALSRLGRHCDNLQCSRFDRRDGLNVWFVEER